MPRAKRKSRAVNLEALLRLQLAAVGLDGHFVRNYPFAPDSSTWIFHKLKGKKWLWEMHEKKRRWRADFACLDARLLIEVDGSTFHRGGHSSGAALENQYLRHAEAELAGWVMIRVTRRMIEETVAIDLITRALKWRLPDGYRANGKSADAV